MFRNPFLSTVVEQGSTNPFQPNLVPPVQQRATNPFHFTTVQQINTNPFFTGVEQSPANPFQNLPSNNGFAFVFQGHPLQQPAINDAIQPTNSLQLNPRQIATGLTPPDNSATKRELGRRKAQEKKQAKEAMTADMVTQSNINDIPFRDYCRNVKFTFEDKLLQEKAEQTTSPQDALVVLGRHFAHNAKLVDHEKSFPRQERINLLIKEKLTPGSTKPKAGMSDASWKHNVNKDFVYSSDQVLWGSDSNPLPFLLNKTDTLYERFKNKQLEAIEKWYSSKSGRLTGQYQWLPEFKPVEDFYEIFLKGHIADDMTHNGRDKAFNLIKYTMCSNYNKELLSALIRECPTCKSRDNKDARSRTVEGTAATRAAKRHKSAQPKFEPQLKIIEEDEVPVDELFASGWTDNATLEPGWLMTTSTMEQILSPDLFPQPETTPIMQQMQPVDLFLQQEARSTTEEVRSPALFPQQVMSTPEQMQTFDDLFQEPHVVSTPEQRQPFDYLFPEPQVTSYPEQVQPFDDLFPEPQVTSNPGQVQPIDLLPQQAVMPAAEYTGPVNLFPQPGSPPQPLAQLDVIDLTDDGVWWAYPPKFVSEDELEKELIKALKEF